MHHPATRVAFEPLLEELGVFLEIGFIMFDPLCTASEIAENIGFLRKNGLAKYASSLGSAMELRLQESSLYMDVLRGAERQYAVGLYERQMDEDTLSYRPHYLQQPVTSLIGIMQSLQGVMRPLYYPLKSVSRYGEVGTAAEVIGEFRAIVVELREMYLGWIDGCVRVVTEGAGDVDELSRDCRRDLASTARRVLACFGRLPADAASNPVLKRISDYANEILREDRRSE